MVIIITTFGFGNIYGRKTKQNNADCPFNMGNKQRSPVLKSNVLLTHPFTPTSSLHGLCRSVATPPDFLLCHLNVNICCFGALAEMAGAVVLPGRTVSNRCTNTPELQRVYAYLLTDKKKLFT